MDALYRPGDIVSANGIYRVTHDEHRLMHEVTLTEGMRFPMCVKCESRVRFTLVRSIRREVIPFKSGQILTVYPKKKSKAKAKAV